MSLLPECYQARGHFSFRRGSNRISSGETVEAFTSKTNQRDIVFWIVRVRQST